MKLSLSDDEDDESLTKAIFSDGRQPLSPRSSSPTPNKSVKCIPELAGELQGVK